MLKTFNCGTGAVLVVDSDSAINVCQQINNSGQRANVIGQVSLDTSG